MTYQTAQISQINMELKIEGSPAKVWAGLTDEIGRWWPAEFFVGADDGGRGFNLEAKPGGRMLETWSDGGGVLWGTVICIQPKTLLQILGTSFPNWGGPAQSYLTWELEPSNDGTLLKFSEGVLGRVSDAGVAEKDKGWQFLWLALRAYVDGGTPPVWED